MKWNGGHKERVCSEVGGWWWCSVAFAIGALASAAVRYRGGETQNVAVSDKAAPGGTP
jgi:hypothetical protein